MFIIPSVLGVVSGQGESGYTIYLYILGMLQKDLIYLYGQWWRMLASAFLHGNAIHLLVNMLALFQLGQVVYTYYGGKLLTSFYVLCGLAGSLASIWFLGDAPAVGASGAVFGLLGVLIAGSLRKSRYGLDLPFDTTQLIPLAVYSLIIGLNPTFAINNWAHLGGLICGFSLGWLIPHQLMTIRPRTTRIMENGLYIFSVGLLVITGAYMMLSFVGWLSGTMMPF
jgi:membrane associated rhomboid family serine protease